MKGLIAWFLAAKAFANMLVATALVLVFLVAA
jgi:hypothetical protein